MKLRLTLSLLAVVSFTARAFALEEPPPKTPPAAEPEQKRSNAHEILNALVRAEAAKKQGATATAPAASSTSAKSAATPAAKTDEAPPPTAAKDAKPADAAAEKAKAKAEPATVLPKVEVNRGRINNNEIDGRIIEQEKEIAREKQAAKPTELDKALNSPKVSKTLSIFGGESSSHRSTVTSERVRIMEEERDLLEAMKAAKTKAEKAELQKQLDELRAYRRELEKSLR